MSLIDLMHHLSEDEKAELEKVNDEMLELAGNCKTPADHVRIQKLLKRQGELLGWKEG